VPHAPQLSASVDVSLHAEPQQAPPLLHISDPVPLPPHVTQEPETHTSFAEAQSAAVEQPHAEAQPDEPQHVLPDAHAAPVEAASQVTHTPDTQTSSLRGQSVALAHWQALPTHARPAPHGEHPEVPGAHDTASEPHVQAPRTHDSPLAQVVPHAPQLAAVVPRSTQVAPQHVSPAAQLPPLVPADPQATQAPEAPHTSLGPGQSPEVTHWQAPAAHTRPGAHAEQPGEPGAHPNASAPHVHFPVAQD
jgi:hypothetical protein